MNKIFTVIILVYNNDIYLKTCLDSVLKQDYPEIEIIVADDYSKVFKKDEIEAYIKNKSKSNIKQYCVYQNECNFGTVKSVNAAIAKSHGQYIKLLAADDALFDHDTLSQAASALDNSPCGIITSNVMKCDENLVQIGTYQTTLLKKLNSLSPIDIFRRLCIHNGIVAGGVFFSKRFFDSYGLFDETYRLLEDWPTWLKCIKQGCVIQYHPFWGINYRSNSGVGTSTNSFYLSDRKKVFENIVTPSKKEIGLFWFLLSFLSFTFLNSRTIRSLYGFVFRKKK